MGADSGCRVSPSMLWVVDLLAKCDLLRKFATHEMPKVSVDAATQCLQVWVTIGHSLHGPNYVISSLRNELAEQDGIRRCEMTSKPAQSYADAHKKAVDLCLLFVKEV